MKKAIIILLVLSVVAATFLTDCLAAPKVTLKMWTWKVAYVPGYEAAAKAYEKKTGVKVEIEVFTPDQVYQQKVTSSASADQLPDIINYWADVKAPFSDKFLDMSTVVDANWKKAIYTDAWYATTVNQDNVKNFAEDKNANAVLKSLKVGFMPGIPMDVGAFFMFYGNKKIMKQAGLTGEAPKTWEEFVAMMKTVKAKTGTPGLVFGAKIPDLWHNWAGVALFIMANGEENYAKLYKRETKMSDPENLRVLKAVETLGQEDLLMPGLLNTGIDEADQAFFAGKAAFDLGGSFTLSTLMAMGMKPEDIVVFPVPPIKGSKYTSWKINPFTLTMLSVAKNTTHKKQALDFVKYLTANKEGAGLFANNAYDIPACSLTDIKKLVPSVAAITRSFSSEPDYIKPIRALHPDKFWQNIEWRTHDTALQRMFGGKATAEDVANEFDTAMAREKEAAQ